MAIITEVTVQLRVSTSGNPYPFASFTHLSYTRDMTWIFYPEKGMTSYTMDMSRSHHMTWISQMQTI